MPTRKDDNEFRSVFGEAGRRDQKAILILSPIVAAVFALVAIIAHQPGCWWGVGIVGVLGYICFVGTLADKSDQVQPAEVHIHHATTHIMVNDEPPAPVPAVRVLSEADQEKIAKEALRIKWEVWASAARVRMKEMRNAPPADPYRIIRGEDGWWRVSMWSVGEPYGLIVWSRQSDYGRGYTPDEEYMVGEPKYIWLNMDGSPRFKRQDRAAQWLRDHLAPDERAYRFDALGAPIGPVKDLSEAKPASEGDRFIGKTLEEIAEMIRLDDLPDEPVVVSRVGNGGGMVRSEGVRMDTHRGGHYG